MSGLLAILLTALGSRRRLPMVACDRCKKEAAWLVFAAYPIDPGWVGSGQVEHYPHPLARVCPAHLPSVLAADEASTGQWMIRPTDPKRRVASS